MAASPQCLACDLNTRGVTTALAQNDEHTLKANLTHQNAALAPTVAPRNIFHVLRDTLSKQPLPGKTQWLAALLPAVQLCSYLRCDAG